MRFGGVFVQSQARFIPFLQQLLGKGNGHCLILNSQGSLVTTLW